MLNPDEGKYGAVKRKEVPVTQPGVRWAPDTSAVSGLPQAKLAGPAAAAKGKTGTEVSYASRRTTSAHAGVPGESGLADLSELYRKFQALSTLVWDEDDEIDAIISYRTILNEGDTEDKGLWLCEALAQELKKSGLRPFHGRMVKGGDNWQEVWFGNMPDAKVAIVMFSPAFFASEACVEELKAILKEPDVSKCVIPVFVAPVSMGKKDDFLESDKKLKKTANFIRSKIDGNCIPPPDKGLFQQNWDTNVALLIQRVHELCEGVKNQ